jgi:hypothetical protein
MPVAAPAKAAPSAWPALHSPRSVWWLVAVAAAFSAAQLLFVPPRLGLGWDEVVYVSQVSGHAPAAYFDAARARGIPLLVAPVALLTSSVAVLRVYLSLMSGLGLLVALLSWRRLRPVPVLALAGVMFAGLWVTQFYGPQAMPDLWVALSGLTAVGCFLQAASGEGWRAGRGPGAAVAGLAVCVAFAALVRPVDAICLAVPLIVAALWRGQSGRASLVIAVAGGLVAGLAEWVAEAYVRFGGLLQRMHDASAEQGGFGFHLGVWDELKALNGPTLCRPCTVGWRYPEISLWWLAMPVLVVIGVLVSRRAGRLGSSLLPAVCGACIGLPYLLTISYAAPRFLLPVYALFALPVADAITWMIARAREDVRPAVVAVVGVCLAIQLIVQHAVLDHEVGGTAIYHANYSRIVTDLRQIGVRPPCLLGGEQYIPIAYYAGCASDGSVRAVAAARTAHAGRAESTALLEPIASRPPGYARSWRRYALPGTFVLRLAAYLPPRPGPR